MLSERLQVLRQRFADYRHDGMEIAAIGVEAIVEVLDQAIDDARALENAPVPPHLRVPVTLASDQHGRVLSLEAWRGRLGRPGAPVGPTI